MNKQSLHLFILFIFLFLLFFLMNTFIIKENFRYCKTCNNQGERNCSNCQNCGWCIDFNYNGFCKEGDKYGPYYKKCKEWYYMGNKIYPVSRNMNEITEIIPIPISRKSKSNSKTIYIFLIIILILLCLGGLLL